MQENVEIIIPNRMELLPVVINNASSIATLMGFQKKEIRNIELGVEEAVGNIIRYAFEEGEREDIRICFAMESLGLGISIFEKGIPFDPSVVKEFSPEKFKENLSDEGLGMYLLKQFMDEFSFTNHGKSGKETRIFKYLHNRKLEQMLDKQEKARVEQEREQEQLPKGSVPFVIRPLKADEAVEVSRCAYTSYGYTYVHEAIYYPERVREMNRNGDLISYVAVNEDNDEIMSHCALEREEDAMLPQVGVAATKPRYRGQGCLNGLNVALIEEATKRGFTGVYGRGISTHFYSQKSMLKHGMKPCALLVSSGKERKYKGIEQKKIQRESVFLQMLYLNRPAKHWVYLPPKHKDMIRRIYAFIGGEPEFRKCDDQWGMPSAASEVSIITNMNSLTADIFVRSFGSDLSHEIAGSMQKLIREELKTIYIYLPLADPASCRVTADLEKLGFFFAGIKPASENKDVLILQYLNNHEIDYDYIASGCEESNEIMKYVKQMDPNCQNKN